MAERMPFSKNAIIDPRKFYDYLLDSNSPDNQARTKARLWAGVGYTCENAELLMELLLRAVRTAEVIEPPFDEGFGLKYRFRVRIPHLKRGGEATVFMTFMRDRVDPQKPEEAYSEHPRLITAYPDRKAER